MRKTTIDVCLPAHPTLTHPRTGEPLRAVGMSRRGPIWPILGGDGTDNGGQGGNQNNGQNGGQGGEGGGAANGQQGNGSGAGTGDDRGYPANTPVAEMTPVQQVAYWKFHARKHETAYKGLGLTAGNEVVELQQLRDAQAELRKRKDSELSDTERLTKERDELAVKVQQMEVDVVRRQALEEAGLPLDDLEFITEVEPAKAKEQAKKLAARLGTNGTRNAGSDQGTRRNNNTPSGAAAGLAEAKRRFGGQSQNTKT